MKPTEVGSIRLVGFRFRGRVPGRVPSSLTKRSLLQLRIKAAKEPVVGGPVPKGARRVTELISRVAASFAKAALARRTRNRYATGNRNDSHVLVVIAVACTVRVQRGLRRGRSSPVEKLRSPLRIACSHASTPHPTYAFRRACLAICANSLATSPCTILLRSNVRGLTSLIRIEKAAFGSEL